MGTLHLLHNFGHRQPFHPTVSASYSPAVTRPPLESPMPVRWNSFCDGLCRRPPSRVPLSKPSSDTSLVYSPRRAGVMRVCCWQLSHWLPKVSPQSLPYRALAGRASGPSFVISRHHAEPGSSSTISSRPQRTSTGSVPKCYTESCYSPLSTCCESLKRRPFVPGTFKAATSQCTPPREEKQHTGAPLPKHLDRGQISSHNSVLSPASHFSPPQAFRALSSSTQPRSEPLLFMPFVEEEQAPSLSSALHRTDFSSGAVGGAWNQRDCTLKLNNAHLLCPRQSTLSNLTGQWPPSHPPDSGRTHFSLQPLYNLHEVLPLRFRQHRWCQANFWRLLLSLPPTHPLSNLGSESAQTIFAHLLHLEDLTEDTISLRIRLRQRATLQSLRNGVGTCGNALVPLDL